MRVTVSHKKTQADAKKAVDSAVEQIMRPDLPGPIKIEDVRQGWQGDTLDFSLKAKMGVMAAPIKGTIAVSDKDITIDCDLPGLLTMLMPESKIKAGIESKVKGLLSA